ncbi:hypothetical protein Q9R08_15970 [Microbacterium sp. QXD-8]|uniref:Uncharacterized protein n=1 Tax=Microbacterium psychrotolerans TaxID=3068321 RepID=A0ABU0Z4H3_9MICO|nr:hypothetical protein [Microbacterium sp. QXD-8]MDQ7879490.1 hypothetical protein [Microbacterium sp. QXD-8]
MTTAIPSTLTPTNPIGAYVPEIISLAKRGLFWAVLYGLFARGSRGGCISVADAATSCYTATLDPSPVVWLAMAVVFVVSLGRASRATDTTVVTRVLRRAATALWALPLLAAVIGLLTFFTADPAFWVHTTPPPNVSVEITTE